MKRMTKGAPMGTPKELETLVWRQEEGRCRAISGKKYREHFLEISGATDMSARYPGLNTGWRQVLRIICGHYWTGKRLVDAKMAREELKRQCPCCTIDEPESVLHIVWECECPAWNEDRTKADTTTGVKRVERESWAVEGIHVMLNPNDAQKKETRLLWLAVFLQNIEARRKARLSLYMLQDSRRGRPVTDGVAI
ncbi:MAG: uncharacterized protein A8A55_2692 [Amphiamblys sp. WSBS2006]|nr:MAG: uncharacterized protein A8A55_2771 [Amphiamblys sp. WSBS2006]OIR56499.1 MAG: uncharacterized protein A8A55_2754 [Amphiamblys sp. WSBS2006]OIR56560.1 MAG: uncharacterized protein A8A55_2694 [Amphiamblys sp. WSBS2006]OIR56561.1 MAG: uncharacterized protein A8A55_2692 [Amphiamblys sp. WSBS2006]